MREREIGQRGEQEAASDPRNLKPSSTQKIRPGSTPLTLTICESGDLRAASRVKLPACPLPPLLKDTTRLYPPYFEKSVREREIGQRGEQGAGPNPRNLKTSSTQKIRPSSTPLTFPFREKNNRMGPSIWLTLRKHFTETVRWKF